jgi:hypothetical protein
VLANLRICSYDGRFECIVECRIKNGLYTLSGLKLAAEVPVCDLTRVAFKATCVRSPNNALEESQAAEVRVRAGLTLLLAAFKAPDVFVQLRTELLLFQKRLILAQHRIRFVK